MTGAGSRNPDSLTIDYSEPDVRIALLAGKHPLFDGPVASELVIDGRPVTAVGEWKSVCSHSDEDGDYLELQLSLGESLRIERQFFLSRADHFALLADAVVATGAGRIEHRLQMPLAEGAAITADVPTRECRIGPARIFPLWLPQDRIQSTPGDCVPGSGLQMIYTVGGPGLYLPLLIDWHPRRRRAAADWRSLTVTEPDRVVSPSGAAGHRLRIGKNQLLIFRGLAATHEPRAVLGQHTRYETLIARFDSDGDIDPLMATEEDSVGEPGT